VRAGGRSLKSNQITGPNLAKAPEDIARDRRTEGAWTPEPRKRHRVPRLAQLDLSAAPVRKIANRFYIYLKMCARLGEGRRGRLRVQLVRGEGRVHSVREGGDI